MKRCFAVRGSRVRKRVRGKAAATSRVDPDLDCFFFKSSVFLQPSAFDETSRPKKGVIKKKKQKKSPQSLLMKRYFFGC